MPRLPLGRWPLVALAVLALVGLPWLARQVRSLPQSRTLAARSSQKVVTLEVGGMTCGLCAAKVQGGLATLRGVVTVEVRLPEHRAYVVCDRSVADTALTAAVARAGSGFLAAVAAR
jgi:copper chaperone CopZ